MTTIDIQQEQPKTRTIRISRKRAPLPPLPPHTYDFSNVDLEQLKQMEIERREKQRLYLRQWYEKNREKHIEKNLLNYRAKRDQESQPKGISSS